MEGGREGGRESRRILSAIERTSRHLLLPSSLPPKRRAAWYNPMRRPPTECLSSVNRVVTAALLGRLSVSQKYIDQQMSLHASA